MNNVVSVDNNSFESKVLKSDLPTLVDFWASWCGPCKMLSPIVDEVSEEFVGKVNFVKINVDDSQELASQYGVRGIPTLILFKGGNVVATKVGVLTKSQLVTFLNENI